MSAQSSQPKCPSTNDHTAWRAYWTAQGMPWRTEPEIDEERQQYLAERRAIRPDVEKGAYPLRDENGPIKLTRADMEWLVATHRGQEGLDLRGADLRSLGLQELPLIRAHGSLEYLMVPVTNEAREKASVHLEGADLRRADLQGARFRDAHLERADLGHANLQGADLSVAHLEAADLSNAILRAANLGGVANGSAVAHLEGALLDWANLESAKLRNARLERARLVGAHLEGANLTQAQLAGADLRRATFDERSNLDHVHLRSKRDGTALLGDVKWNGVDLTLVEWREVKRLGDEMLPKSPRPSSVRYQVMGLSVIAALSAEGERFWARVRARFRTAREQQSSASKAAWGLLIVLLVVALFATLSTGLQELFEPYRSAARAYRRLSMALREQGMADEADRFAYRAQVCQRRMLFRGLRIPRWLLSWLLCIVAGYGYRPLRTLFWYVVFIFGFTLAYLHFGQINGRPFAFDEALVFSVTSFHGRGFFPGGLEFKDLVTKLAALEAVIGLFIEVSFIATFTQRFFAR